MSTGSSSSSPAEQTVRAGITRVHIEEDTGRLVHRTATDGSEVSLVDLNRSGVPLMEIVGEPDLRSPEEARDYLIALRQILRYIGASTGNMEDGRVPLRRQCLDATRPTVASSAPRSKSRT